MCTTMYGQKRMLEMTQEEHEKAIFSKAVQLNKDIWKLIEDIQYFTNEIDNEQIRKFVDLSGHLHVEILRPLYKKHPELVQLLEK